MFPSKKKSEDEFRKFKFRGGPTLVVNISERTIRSGFWDQGGWRLMPLDDLTDVICDPSGWFGGKLILKFEKSSDVVFKLSRIYGESQSLADDLKRLARRASFASVEKSKSPLIRAEDTLGKLERLQSLMEKGVLTEQEFLEQKMLVLQAGESPELPVIEITSPDVKTASGPLVTLRYPKFSLWGWFKRIFLVVGCLVLGVVSLGIPFVGLLIGPILMIVGIGLVFWRTKEFLCPSCRGPVSVGYYGVNFGEDVSTCSKCKSRIMIKWESY